MNRWSQVLCLLPALLAVSAAAAKTQAATLAMKYEGGTLPLEQGRTHATISDDKVVFTQGRYTLAIPLEHIATIACSTGVRRRFGAPVLGVVPRLHLDTAETYYVGLTWMDASRDGQPGTRTEGVFKLRGSEYSEFLGTLERLTGKAAVDTGRVPAVVRYGI